MAAGASAMPDPANPAPVIRAPPPAIDTAGAGPGTGRPSLFAAPLTVATTATPCYRLAAFLGRGPFLGRLQVKPDHVGNLASSCGSMENLNISRFHGCGPYSGRAPATFTFDTASRWSWD